MSHGFTATGLVTSEPHPSDRVQESPVLPGERQRQACGTATSMPSPGRLHKFNLGLGSTSRVETAALSAALTLDTGVGVDDLLRHLHEPGRRVDLRWNPTPSTANAWQISGQYKLGPVIGDRPLVKLGGDLIAITSDGYIPLLQFLGAGREQRQLAISDKIAPTVTQSVFSFGSVAGLASDSVQRGQLAAVQRA